MDINFEYVSITGKNFSSFGRHLGKIFKILIAVLFMGHPVYCTVSLRISETIHEFFDIDVKTRSIAKNAQITRSNI